MKSECVVVSNGGSLFLVGPTGQTYRMTLWERIQMALTNRYPQRGLDVVYANTQPLIDSESESAETAINCFTDDLFVLANPPPLRGDVWLRAYMPGAKHYQEALKRCQEGQSDHWTALAHWVDSADLKRRIAPTRFVFVASCPDFDKAYGQPAPTGLTQEFLNRKMLELAASFADRVNQSACRPTIRLYKLNFDNPAE